MTPHRGTHLTTWCADELAVVREVEVDSARAGDVSRVCPGRSRVKWVRPKYW